MSPFAPWSTRASSSRDHVIAMTLGSPASSTIWSEAQGFLPGSLRTAVADLLARNNTATRVVPGSPWRALPVFPLPTSSTALPGCSSHMTAIVPPFFPRHNRHCGEPQTRERGGSSLGAGKQGGRARRRVSDHGLHLCPRLTTHLAAKARPPARPGPHRTRAAARQRLRTHRSRSARMDRWPRDTALSTPCGIPHLRSRGRSRGQNSPQSVRQRRGPRASPTGPRPWSSGVHSSRHLRGRRRGACAIPRAHRVARRRSSASRTRRNQHDTGETVQAHAEAARGRSGRASVA